MPELPEVESTKEGLRPLLGAKIQSVFLGHPLREAWAVELSTHLNGRRIQGLSRRAKYVIIELDDGASLLIHLGMSGRLSIINPLVTQEKGRGKTSRLPLRQKHDHFELIFEDGRSLRLNDPRRFGAVHYQAVNTHHRRLEHLGPEPLEKDFTVDYLWAKAQGKETPIKPFIMDQNVVVGVGNIYASEALFMAGIHPHRKAGRVSKVRIEKLVGAIQQVLRKSLAEGGTTLRDYRKPDGEKGTFVQRLKVYGREGEACVVCSTPIKSMTLGQRSSFYCPHCQK